MELTEDEIIEKMLENVDIAYKTFYYHMNMNGLVSLVDTTQSKENTNLLKFNEKSFISRINFAEHKIFCKWVDVYKIMLENPDFEHNHYSRTADGVYKIGHDGIRLMKWLA